MLLVHRLCIVLCLFLVFLAVKACIALPAHMFPSHRKIPLLHENLSFSYTMLFGHGIEVIVLFVFFLSILFCDCGVVFYKV